MFAALPRMAGAMLRGLGPATVKATTLRVNRENLSDLASLLESGTIQVIIDETYPFGQAAAAVARMLGHHACGQVVIAVP